MLSFRLVLFLEIILAVGKYHFIAAGFGKVRIEMTLNNMLIVTKVLSLTSFSLRFRKTTSFKMRSISISHPLPHSLTNSLMLPSEWHVIVIRKH